jgi:hypothetical protein
MNERSGRELCLARRQLLADAGRCSRSREGRRVAVPAQYLEAALLEAALPEAALPEAALPEAALPEAGAPARI